MTGDRWYSVDAISNYLGIKNEIFYKRLAYKDMSAHKVGNLWTFRKDEID